MLGQMFKALLYVEKSARHSVLHFTKSDESHVPKIIDAWIPFNLVKSGMDCYYQ